MISIIIPVYNVSAYVGRCTRSLMEQSFSDLEYIFVDDASSDNSIAEIENVLDSYPNRRQNVRIIRMICNCGVSSARNRGILEAKGEFIGFCDSDDWIAPGMYESLYRASKEHNADVVFSDLFLEKEDSQQYYHVAGNQGSKINFLKEYLGSRWTPVINYIVKKELIISNHLFFPIGISMCEDLHFSIRMLYYSENPVNVRRAFYHYDMTRCDSAVHDISNTKSRHQLEAYLDLISFFKEKGIDRDMQREMSWRILINKRHMIYDTARHKEFIAIYPESAKYIFSCPWLKIKMKLLMWALTHHLRFITFLIISARNRIKQTR